MPPPHHSSVLTRHIVPHVLYFCTLLNLHRQSVALPSFRLPQRISHHYRLHPLFRCASTDGHGGETTDEHPQPKVRVRSWYVSAAPILCGLWKKNVIADREKLNRRICSQAWLQNGIGQVAHQAPDPEPEHHGRRLDVCELSLLASDSAGAVGSPWLAIRKERKCEQVDG